MDKAPDFGSEYFPPDWAEYFPPDWAEYFPPDWAMQQLPSPLATIDRK